MKKSGSSPHLSALATLPPKLSKRCMSTQALVGWSPSIDTVDVQKTILDELQLEAIIHVTGYHAGQCMMQAPPLSATQASTISSEDAKNLALCLATPPDYPIRSSILTSDARVELSRNVNRRREEPDVNTAASTAS